MIANNYKYKSYKIYLWSIVSNTRLQLLIILFQSSLNNTDILFMLK